METRESAPVQRLDVSAFTIPTDAPEADGTIEWTSTTMVLVEVTAGGRCGLGYSYADPAAAALIRTLLSDLVLGHDAFDIERAYAVMQRSVRNVGHDGIAASAISAVDSALWDLKARLLDLPLIGLLGAVRDAIPLYGSGGFTTYSAERLAGQLGGWIDTGIRAVKMKVGRDPAADRSRVSIARGAIGTEAALFVDANGAYDRKLALEQAHAFAAEHVSWFEEPVSSDDLEGLRLLRDTAPREMEIAAGEYGYNLQYFRRMLEAGCVDVLQADATRCGGITGLLRAGAVADAYGMPMSAHTAPGLHAHVCCAIPRMRHLEYFHDHARLEGLLFDGVLPPVGGALHPDRSRPGNGLVFKRTDAMQWAL